MQLQFDNRGKDTFLSLCILLTRDLKRPIACRASRKMRMKKALGVVHHNPYWWECSVGPRVT
jgi:hypothetical protein